jgi:hypothetical protein
MNNIEILNHFFTTFGITPSNLLHLSTYEVPTLLSVLHTLDASKQSFAWFEQNWHIDLVLSLKGSYLELIIALEVPFDILSLHLE